MGNRAKRRAYALGVMKDPRLTDFHRQLALTMAFMDRRGFILCELDGKFYFEPNSQYALSHASAGIF
ncbi:hypothetical protein ABIB83_004635 [Bradyrhizobium sp. I1.8.5]